MGLEKFNPFIKSSEPEDKKEAALKSAGAIGLGAATGAVIGALGVTAIDDIKHSREIPPPPPPPLAGSPQMESQITSATMKPSDSPEPITIPAGTVENTQYKDISQSVEKLAEEEQDSAPAPSN
ncbi:MAG: hypothetical protein P4M11_05150 [Candidatus Pacebacteria bacterium]|nr:hypothetical protein [Candidatus Paceibacterota bacterium]